MFATTFSLLVLILVGLAGVGLGAAGYRYMLRRNPEKLEAWATAIREARERVQQRLEK